VHRLNHKLVKLSANPLRVVGTIAGKCPMAMKSAAQPLKKSLPGGSSLFSVAASTLPPSGSTDWNGRQPGMPEDQGKHAGQKNQSHRRMIRVMMREHRGLQIYGIEGVRFHSFISVTGGPRGLEW